MRGAQPTPAAGPHAKQPSCKHPHQTQYSIPANHHYAGTLIKHRMHPMQHLCSGCHCQQSRGLCYPPHKGWGQPAPVGACEAQLPCKGRHDKTVCKFYICSLSDYCLSEVTRNGRVSSRPTSLWDSQSHTATVTTIFYIRDRDSDRVNAVTDQLMV